MPGFGEMFSFQKTNVCTENPQMLLKTKFCGRNQKNITDFFCFGLFS